MSDESTHFILGDSAVDATEEGRRGLRRRRKRREGDRALTHCENCGAPLAGEYCAKCGQHAIDYRRSLWRVLIDAADSFLNWDTKFLSSVWVLLTRPWKLTNDFNAGRRARYVHPLRLYLLASIAFFLMLKLVNFNSGPMELRPQDRAEIAAALGKLVGSDSVLTADQQAKVDSVRARLVQGESAISEKERNDIEEVVRVALASEMKDKFAKADRAKLKAALRMIPEIPTPPAPPGTKETARAEAKAEAAREIAAESIAKAMPENLMLPTPGSPSDIPTPPPLSKNRRPGIHFGPDDKEKTPFGNWIESRIKNKVGEDGTKSKLFLETLRNNIPTMMLCCIPLFALVLKMLYFRKGRYYVEHLVYALHIHTFAYVGVTLIVLLSLAIAQLSDPLRAIFATFAGIAMCVLVLLSIRRVYGQGWFFTTFKFLLGSIAYAVILIIAVGTTAFVTLLLPD